MQKINYRNPLDKIYQNPEDLLPLLDNLRREEKTIVFGNGCFDIVHPGHTRYLSSARQLGDVLVIAVNTDESLNRIKPDKKIAQPYHERVEVIANFESVDYVVPLKENTPIFLLNLFKPHIHTKGTDYTLDRLPERETVESYGGKIMFVGGPKDYSTTKILEKIVNSHK